MEKDIGRRIDLHIHSIFSDGSLVPSEIAQRANHLGYEAIAITDHVDSSNLETVVPSMVSVSRDLNKHMGMKVIPGVEITHVPILMIDNLASKAKKLGAQLVVVHGESIVEPVLPNTNMTAVSSKNVDILAHPGLLSEEEGRLAEKNRVYLELSARQGHCLANGRVARVAMETGAKLLLNTDLHQPEEFLTQDQAFQIVIGAGLGRGDAVKVVKDYPEELIVKVTQGTG